MGQGYNLSILQNQRAVEEDSKLEEEEILRDTQYEDIEDEFDIDIIDSEDDEIDERPRRKRLRRVGPSQKWDVNYPSMISFLCIFLTLLTAIIRYNDRLTAAEINQQHYSQRLDEMGKKIDNLIKAWNEWADDEAEPQSEEPKTNGKRKIKVPKRKPKFIGKEGEMRAEETFPKLYTDNKGDKGFMNRSEDRYINRGNND